MRKINFLIYLTLYSALFFFKSLRELYLDLKSETMYFFYCNLNFLRNKNFKNFIKKNSELTKNYFNDKIDEKNKKFLLLDIFIFHPAYIANQFIIANYLKKILNLNIIILTLNNNSLIKNLGKSYGIEKFIKLKKPGLLRGYFIFLSVFNDLFKIKNLNDFKNLKSNKVKLGEIAYDHYIRFTGDLQVDKVNFKLMYFYFKATCYDTSIRHILNDSNCSGLILSETQFIPSAIVFQNTLEKNLNVYSRYGGPKYIGVRIYNNINEIYSWKQKINKTDFEEIKNKFKVEAENDGYKIIYNRVNLISNKQDLNDTEIAYKKKTTINKKELCSRFNWDENLPIVGIFDHSYTDGLFICGRSIFETNYAWISYTLKEIQNINNVNWLIKDHPEKSYETHKANTSTRREFYKIVDQKKNNIKLFPNGISALSLFNILSTIITGNGTVGLEYSVFGTPTILANNSHYSGFDFTHEPNSLDEYSNYLKNIHKLDKLNEEQKSNARIFVSIELNQSIANLGLLPKFIPNSQIFFKKNYDEFWSLMCNEIKDFDLKKDEFYIELKRQILNKKSHTIKFNYQN